MASDIIIVADDHPVFRDGLRTLIQNMLPAATVLASDSYEQALALARSSAEPPTLFVLDLFFARKSIKPDLPALRAEFDRAAIVVVTMAEDRQTIAAVMGHGVNGFITKSVPPQEIGHAIAAVLDGDIVVQVPDADSNGEAGMTLSERQMEMLQHIADGKTNKQIAIALAISPFTVRIHVSALFRSLNVGSRAAAVSKGVSEGLLAPR